MKKTRRSTLVAAAILFAAVTPARAEMTASSFFEFYDSPSAMVRQSTKSFLEGITSGLGWANALAATDGNPRTNKLYCQPKNLELTHPQSLNMLRRYVEKFPRRANDPVGLAMFGALHSTFPCEEGK